MVGRQRELAALLGALDAALDANGSLVLLAGEPGIGKTTLAEELAGQARAVGARTVWGRGWDAGGAPAYWPWRQVVRQLADEQSDEELAADAGSDARWLVTIAPELDARLSGADPVEPRESEQARFAQFDALATFLRAHAARGPLVVLLDDMHSADAASLHGIDFVARSLADAPVLLIAALQETALRRRPEVAQLVGALERHGERVALGGLDVEEIGQLLAQRGGTPVTEDVARSVHERTNGNPLFAEEVGRAIAGREVAGDPGLALTSSISGMMRDRVAALGEEGERTLVTAAVIGHQFRLAVLERAVGLTRAEVLDVLDEAQELELVVAQDEAAVFRFRHGVTRDALYQGLRGRERAEAHLRAGEALREVRGEEEVSELAHHFLEAARLGDAGPGVEYSRRAGEQALAIFAFEQAAHHFEMALRALDLGVQDDGTRARLMLSLAIAKDGSGDGSADVTLLEAAELARQLGDSELLAEIALAFGPYALSPGTVDDVWTGLVQEAIRAVGADHPALRARLLARLGRALYFARGQGDQRAALAEESVALARSLDDPQTLAEVLGDAHVAIWGPDRAQDCLAWIGEMRELLDGLGDSRRGLPAMVRAVDLQLELGDVAGADMALGEMEQRARELKDVRAITLAPLHRARQAILEGRFADVEPLAQEAMRQADILRYSPVDIIVGGQSFGLALLCGGLTELEQKVRQYADALPGMPVWRAALARAYVDGGRIPQARRELDRMAADCFSQVERDSTMLLTLALFAEVAWRIGAAEHAPVLRGLLEPFADRMIVSTGGVFLGPVARSLGQLAALEGDVDRAFEHFAAARDAALSIGAGPSIALVDVDEAAVRIEAGDLEGARVLLDAADGAATALGMPGVAERVARLRADAGAPASPEPTAPEPVAASVTGVGSLRREGDVWLLALDGRSIRLRDAKGVHHLATLLANPGADVHAVDLVAGHSAPAGTTAVGEAGMFARGDIGDAGPVLDAAAKSAYKARIADLRETLDEAERFNDPERAAAAREELDLIAAELAGAVGLGGRDRRAASTTERARVNVTRAIRGTLRRIADHDPQLGGELEATVRTGTHCRYEPSPLHPVTWEVDLAGIR